MILPGRMRGEILAMIPPEWGTRVTMEGVCWMGNEVYGVQEEGKTDYDCVRMVMTLADIGL